MSVYRFVFVHVQMPDSPQKTRHPYSVFPLTPLMCSDSKKQDHQRGLHVFYFTRLTTKDGHITTIDEVHDLHDLLTIEAVG